MRFTNRFTWLKHKYFHTSLSSPVHTDNNNNNNNSIDNNDDDQSIGDSKSLSKKTIGNLLDEGDQLIEQGTNFFKYIEVIILYD